MAETTSVTERYTKKKKKKVKSVEDLASDAAKGAGAGVPQGNNSGAKGLDGRPLGSPIVTNVEWKAPLLPGQTIPIRKTTQYFPGSGRNWFLTLKNTERAEYLAMLSQIPGLYAKGEAYRPLDLQTMAGGGTMIPPRPEDITAIERVMLYADTVGTDVQQGIKYLFSNPAMAQTYFDVSTLTKGTKKVRLTPSDILALEVNQRFQDYLDVKADKDTIEKYVDKVNDLEVSRGRTLIDAERSNILLDLIQTKAQDIFKDDPAPDSLLMQRGALGGAYNTLRKVYRDYGVTVDDKTVYKQAIQSVRSQQAMENTIQKIQIQAQVAFPSLEKYYAQGLSTRDALANHIGLFSKIYNVPDNDIDLDKIYPALKDNKIMSMDEWKSYLYSLPEFAKTDMYKQRSFSDASVLMNNFFGGI